VCDNQQSKRRLILSMWLAHTRFIEEFPSELISRPPPSVTDND
jgi:hypothetical protein